MLEMELCGDRMIKTNLIHIQVTNVDGIPSHLEDIIR